MALKPSSAALAALALGACAAEKPASDIVSKTDDPVSTGQGAAKPGAAVEVKAVQRAAVDPGEIGVVEFTFAESYVAGSMTVTAAGSEGLEILPPDPEATMPMDGAREHRWDVSFRAAAPGTYYVDLFILALGEEGEPESRSFSTRVLVGPATAASKTLSRATTVDGEPVVTMQADETVVD